MTARTGCALIMKNDEVVGIFTRRDVLHRLAKPDLNPANVTIGSVMTPSPEVLLEDNTIACALNKMALESKRHIPIRKADGTTYVFSVRDVLRYFF